MPDGEAYIRTSGGLQRVGRSILIQILFVIRELDIPAGQESFLKEGIVSVNG